MLFIRYPLICFSQASESSNNIASRKYETLSRELEQARDQAKKQKKTLEKEVRALQDQNRSLQEDADERQDELSSLDRQYKHQLQEIDAKHNALQRTVNDLRTDLENKSTVLQSTQERLSERETEAGQLESEVLRLKAQTGDTETLAVIKRELSDQVAHIRKLESTNREQSGELRHYKRIHKAVELVEEEKLLLENKLRLMVDLRSDLREAQLQRQILEDERQSWASYIQNTDGDIEFDSPEALARALVQQRVENVSLVERLGKIQPELSEKDEIIKNLENEQDSIKAEIEKVRAAGGGGDGRLKARLERQRALAVKEVEYLRDQLKTYNDEEQNLSSETHFDEQKAKQIQHLESLVDQYRAELQRLHDDLTKRENDHIPSNSPSLKRPREEEPDERLGQLSRKIRTLQDELLALQNKYALLEKDHAASLVQLTSLQKSSKTRILSLRENPTSTAETIKLSTLTSLRAENAALLAQLEEPSRPPVEVVPISTLENARAEYQALQTVIADREKQMLRNKQVYTKVAAELREAVANLLGWEITPMSSGRMRVKSLFNPGNNTRSDDEGQGENSLIFDGDSGQFKVGTGPDSEFAREIRPLIQFWVEERKTIPLFLAAATMEFYDKTTKAARALSVASAG